MIVLADASRPAESDQPVYIAGVSSKHDFDVNSLAVPRKAKEAIGGIARLRHEDGRCMTINVEYNQLDPLLRATGDGQGDVNNEDGWSPYPGQSLTPSKHAFAFSIVCCIQTAKCSNACYPRSAPGSVPQGCCNGLWYNRFYKHQQKNACQLWTCSAWLCRLSLSSLPVIFCSCKCCLNAVA